MNRDEIKTLENALEFINELEQKHSTHKVEVDGLTSKLTSFEKINSELKQENENLKKQVYDYWIQIPREDNRQEVKSGQVKEVIDDLETLLIK